ncbi:MAG: argininosuccinate lyase [Verrucomicrobiota bacterium]|jgi:argininosuccinate lyase
MRHGRFEESMSTLLRDYGESVSFDWRLYRHDIRGSIAHARALQIAGFLSQGEFELIEEGLKSICDEIEAGKFVFSVDLEDIHMNIEKELTNRIGDAGAKLHTARSRNDQVATDLRLYLRDEISALQSGVRALQSSLVGLARDNEEVLIPGYTHLQRAQPIPLAHHLLAYIEMFDRDHGRLGDVALRMDELPLGSGALAGSTLVLDRGAIAKELGFSRVTQNSLDGVSDRDFALELLSALAIVGMHLSRLSEDVVLWTTAEFAFASLSDRHSTGSSLMPQKKNPDIAELTRGKTGRLYGNLFRLLTVLKGLPMAYNRDLQEDKEAVFDSVDTARMALAVTAEMMGALVIKKEVATTAASDPALLATDLADELVRKNVPFRAAHDLIGKLAAESSKTGVPLDQLPVEVIREYCPQLLNDWKSIFDPIRSLKARAAIGAPSPANVSERLAHWKKLLG